jgi:hypothetical protein
VNAPSGIKSRLLIELCDHFASGNERLAAKTVVFSYKANELIQPRSFITEMAPLPAKAPKSN